MSLKQKNQNVHFPFYINQRTKYINMAKFDQLIDSTLNEQGGFLSGLKNVAASTAGGIGSAIKAAEDPSQLFKQAGTAIDALQKQKDSKSTILGKDNPPKKGQYINMTGNTNIVGKIIDVRNDGSFSVQLIHVSPELENAINSRKNIPIGLFSKSETAKKSDFLFVLTNNNPTKWQLVTRDKAKELGKLSNVVIPENFNKFFVLFNSIIEEKRKRKRTRKPRNQNSTDAIPQQLDSLPKPPDGTVINTSVGDNTYNAETDEWIMPNGKPNPAPGQLNNRWMNQATQEQEQEAQQQAPEPQQPQQIIQQTGESKPKDKLLVVNGRGKFTDTAWVGQGTGFPNWVAIPTTNQKVKQDQPATEQQQEPQQQNQQTQPQPQAQTQPQAQQNQQTVR